MTNREIIKELNKHYLDTLSYYESFIYILYVGFVFRVIYNLIVVLRRVNK